MAKTIPDGYHTLTPGFTVRGASDAIDFYARAFGAVEEFRAYGEDGERIMHARFRINGNALLLSDDFPEFRGGAPAPAPAGMTIHLEVEDADRWWKRAVDAGAEIRMPLGDQFWGDRYGQLKDPFGHSWSIGMPIRK